MTLIQRNPSRLAVALPLALVVLCSMVPAR
jgi:hypothetical protein